MKAILVGNYRKKMDIISWSQIYPFFENREMLKSRLGLEFHHLQADTFPEIEKALWEFPGTQGCEFIFVRPSWRHDTEEAMTFFSGLRTAYPHKKIVLVDPWDQVTGRYLSTIEHVDYIFKYQALRDPQDYLKPYVGGTVVTNYLSNELGFDIGDWNVGSTPPADRVERILPGWNFATTPRFQKALMPGPFAALLGRRKREIDVFCRLSYGGANEWYGKYRKMAVSKIRALGSDYRIAVSGDSPDEEAISSRQYFNEIKRSRIVVSPFGWGEVTWRDYEAIAYGCLLVKPRIDHVATNPDVFEPGETYVPLSWDYSDVVEKCRYYLENWDKAEAIVQEAQWRYIDYFKQDRFVDIIGRVLV